MQDKEKLLAQPLMLRRDYRDKKPQLGNFREPASKIAAYSHAELLSDFSKAMGRGDIKGNPSDLKPKEPGKVPVKSGGLLEVLHDITERFVPQIEKYIEKFTGGTHQDEVLTSEFRKQVGVAAKAYSETYSRLQEIHDLLFRSIRFSSAGGKDHAIISLLEEISETGAKQGFKKLKGLGFSTWTKEFFSRVQNLQKAVEGLTFK